METTVMLILSLLKSHEILAYVVIFALSIPEGPILTVICGFLVTQGILNPLIVYTLVVVGDMAGDSSWYAIGRFGGNWFLPKYGHKLGLTAEKLESARLYFKSRRMRSLTLSKLIHGVGVVGLALAGSVKAPYWEYVGSCLLISLGQSLFLLVWGILAGHAYQKVALYLNIWAAVGNGIVMLIAGLMIIRKITSKIS